MRRRLVRRSAAVVQMARPMLFTVVDVVTVGEERAAFTDFAAAAEPRLHRAFTLLRGVDDGLDASAEALGWAWEHWTEVQAMANPVGYLYRVGSSRTRRRPQRFAPPPVPADAPGFEPALVPPLSSETGPGAGRP